MDFSRLLTDDYFQKPEPEIHCHVEVVQEPFEEIRQDEIRESLVSIPIVMKREEEEPVILEKFSEE